MPRALPLLRNCKQKLAKTFIYSPNVHRLLLKRHTIIRAVILIDVFVDGLMNDQPKHKILKHHPDTLQVAISVATNEQNFRARVNMSHRTSEAMEVDHS